MTSNFDLSMPDDDEWLDNLETEDDLSVLEHHSLYDAMLMLPLSGGLDVGSRDFLGSSYRQCFEGSEAVDWVKARCKLLVVYSVILWLSLFFFNQNYLLNIYLPTSYLLPWCKTRP